MLVITTIFDGSVVGVHCLDKRVERRGFVLGIDRRADQVCDGALLPSDYHALVRTRGDWFQIALVDGSAGFDGFYRDGEEVLSLSALRASGLLIPAEDEPGVSLFEMPRRGELDLTIGLLRVVIATAERPLRVPRWRPFDGTLLGPVTAVALLTLMVAAMVAALPPMPKLLRLPEDARARLGIAPPRTAHFLVSGSNEQDPFIREWGYSGLSRREWSLPRMGRPDSILKADRLRSDHRTPGSNPSTQPAPRPAGAAESSPGTRSLMEGLLAGSTLGAEAAAALQILRGGDPSESSGLGLAGSGPAGGGDQIVASGSLKGYGRAEGTMGSCTPFCLRRLHGGTLGSPGWYRESPRKGCDPRPGHPNSCSSGDGPIVVLCGTQRCAAHSNADKEAIRRVVRQHHNEIRFCYERALQHDETLKGRVTVSFSLDPLGKVLRADVLETTLPSPEVSTCIAAAFQRWQFPSMGQALEVHYPVQLTSESD